MDITANPLCCLIAALCTLCICIFYLIHRWVVCIWSHGRTLFSLFEDIFELFQAPIFVALHPCVGHSQIKHIDAIMSGGLSHILNIFYYSQWLQAISPIRDICLTVQQLSFLAPSAFLTSAAGTRSLQSFNAWEGRPEHWYWWNTSHRPLLLKPVIKFQSKINQGLLAI